MGEVLRLGKVLREFVICGECDLSFAIAESMVVRCWLNVSMLLNDEWSFICLDNAMNQSCDTNIMLEEKKSRKNIEAYP